MKEIKGEPQASDESDAYDIGYGKPPKEHQFKSGQSGNPRGRKKGARSRRAIVKAVATELHRVNVEGLPDRISTLELVLLALREMAMKGDVTAFRLIERLRDRYSPDEHEHSYGVLVVPAELSVKEWVERANRLNAERARERAEALQSQAAETQKAEGDDVTHGRSKLNETVTPGRLSDLRLKNWARVIR